MAGVAGLEPANAGVKVPCLTTWRHPNIVRFYLSVRLRCANPRHVFPYCQHFFHLLCAFRIWVIGDVAYREAPRTCRARVFIHSRSNLYSINGRMHTLCRVWMREMVPPHHGSAYETELETFPSRNVLSSLSLTQDCVNIGGSEETRTLMLKQRYLKPLCIPIPPQSHIVFTHNICQADI